VKNEKPKHHIDLFSGIGGFALAAESVWPGIKHTFVEWDSFCQAVLRKHWPEAEIHGDIRKFIADTKSARQLRAEQLENSSSGEQRGSPNDFEQKGEIFILTGGFPCQPFSHAGRRKGTDDDRYLWPEMREAISLFKPDWVIAENVAGLITWNEGMVLETVCADMEREGYEVIPFVIPACAVGAPHRRDRVWIVGHANGNGRIRRDSQVNTAKGEQSSFGDAQGRHSEVIGDAPDTTGDRRTGGGSSITDEERPATQPEYTGELEGRPERPHTDAPDTDNAKNSISERGYWRMESSGQVLERKSPETEDARPGWESNWPEIAQRLCRMDDGIPSRLGGLTGGDYKLYPWWRTQALKAYGNAIVPKVAEQIMQAINEITL
jgi:DNA (cytosine-5)-methyltransferase 1